MPYLDHFWAYLESLPNEIKEKFLQFTTGTNRPPLLGFKYLTPVMRIAKSGNF